jgi:hypothetical protein
MNITLIEQGVKQVLLTSTPENFIFDLLLAYGKPKTSITRLAATGAMSYNLAKKQPGVVLWKGVVCYVRAQPGRAADAVAEYRDLPAILKHRPRLVVSTDFDRVVALDTKLGEQIDISYIELPNHFTFFLPWAGMEKSQHASDSPADVKAAEKMAKLYDIIAQDNYDPENPPDAESIHNLNVFLSRLLFCFFAEDTEIFASKLFCRSVEEHTSKDGSDLESYLKALFLVLNTEDRNGVPAYLQPFPYVNGGLFAEDRPVPKFSARSRDLLIKCGFDLNWSEINPDIFGSMIQAVVDVEQRSSMGMHYTNVANIMKVIDPLFLHDLKVELEGSRRSEKRLRDLLQRLPTINVFDPACGSGNFLIIAYKEIRRLEMEVLAQLQELTGQEDFGLSAIQLSQFYGIELDDFAHEVALLSMWLAEHQMNQAFLARFGRAAPPLPLKPSGNIVCDNATAVEWSTICPHDANKLIFVIGNPPYLGARNQDEDQKRDLCEVFDGHPDYKDSDYVAVWILKASDYIKGTSAKFAFVSTSSICQGEQVSYIWPRVLARGLEIEFAHQPFKWSNRAKKNAGVSCVVVGVRRVSKGPKFLFNLDTRATVANISPYLIPGTDTCVARTSEITSGLPRMMIGSMARGKDLIMDEDAKDEIVRAYPKSKELFKRLTGTDEFIKGEFRWCLWIEDEQLSLAMSVPPVRRRIEAVRKFREDSKAKTTNEYARIPHKFAQRCYEDRASIIVPATSSERREYIPIGYLEPGVVITNSANAIYDASTFVFGLVSSRIHIVWVRSIGGQLESRLRYAAEICYNTFPVPKYTAAQKRAIEVAALAVLDRREQYPDMSIEELYDPDTMPVDLRAAHVTLDEAVDKIFRPRAFSSDEDRLELLLALYEKTLETANA